MPSDVTVGADGTVVGSIDPTESADRYIIADISVDGAWLSMRADEAPTLPSMR
ncbi:MULTISPECIES: DUF7556 family protein [Natronococcus]|uniref:Uncharacterized protein n=1 Tax=Natronococcus jeotgali DSM 18795 TaxID=1227498 RepID=L9XR49_9EURY|nr:MULTISPECIES: hypothetical protein [Natronococcus]ELY64294.1 hypothetical protein C492_05180 [Natronococcus jeotgali DSM 18795]NKE34634.1 hypothetical protein [Natronococcus sp. JC468]